MAWPNFWFRGHPMLSYRVSMGVLVFSATWRMIECTILPLLYRSSHLTISSGDTRRFERSMYPGCSQTMSSPLFSSIPSEEDRSHGGKRTLFLVDSQNHDDLISANSDEFLDGSNTSARQLREQDHAVDIIVLEELNIGTHLSYLFTGQVRYRSQY